MTERRNVYQPAYYAQFQCAGSACPDTCCIGMTVVVDRATLAKWQASSHPVFANISEAVVPLEGGDPKRGEFRLNPVEGACPYLDRELLCSVQSTLGEEALPATCAVYPRFMTHVDQIERRSLYMSCPEAVRLALLPNAPMRFERTTALPHPRVSEFASIDTAADLASAKPYADFDAISEWSISVLQDRRYSLWQRLTIIGLFCEQLDTMVKQASAICLASKLVAEFDELRNGDALRPLLATVEALPTIQLVYAIQTIEDRLASEPAHPRFLHIYHQFLTGIEFESGKPTDELSKRFAATWERHGAALMHRTEHVLENYAVNYAFKNLFPLGPQRSLYYDQKPVFEEFITVSLLMSLLQSLLLGNLSACGGAIDDDAVIETVQSFSKTIEQNPPLVKRRRDHLIASGMGSLGVMAGMLKGA